MNWSSEHSLQQKWNLQAHFYPHLDNKVFPWVFSTADRITVHVKTDIQSSTWRYSSFPCKCPPCELPDVRTLFDRHGAFSWICRVLGNNGIASLHVSYFPKLTRLPPPAEGQNKHWTTAASRDRQRFLSQGQRIFKPLWSSPSPALLKGTKQLSFNFYFYTSCKWIIMIHRIYVWNLS